MKKRERMCIKSLHDYGSSKDRKSSLYLFLGSKKDRKTALFMNHLNQCKWNSQSVSKSNVYCHHVVYYDTLQPKN